MALLLRSEMKSVWSIKSKVTLLQARCGPEGTRPIALEAGGRSAARPGRFTPGKDAVPIVQEPGWSPGPVWTGAENLVPTRIRSPDRPARSLSLTDYATQPT